MVRYLAAEAGIRQFLDTGTGLLTSPNVHEVAHGIIPEARIVYVDNDPVIHAHANALLTGTGTTKIVPADLRDPEQILAAARDFLDFTKPVALLLVAILHFIPDEDDPAGIAAAYRDALPDGSFLALSHGTADFHPDEVTSTATSAYDGAAAPLVLRPKAAIEAFLDGFTPKPPGLVRAPLWYLDTTPKREDEKKIGIYAAVAKKVGTRWASRPCSPLAAGRRQPPFPVARKWRRALGTSHSALGNSHSGCSKMARLALNPGSGAARFCW